MQFITLLDYFLLPFYLGVIYLIAINFRNKNYPVGHPWRRYFLPGLTVKLVGAIGIGLIYQYYYGGGGDTVNYHYHATIINSALKESVGKWFNLILHIPDWYDGQYFDDYTSKMWWYDAPTEYIVACITAFLGVFAFNCYLPVSVMLGSIAFTGIWALFRTFATKYPQYVKQVAISVLFIPSTVMWGSGIFKDTVCMFGLGWMTYGAFRLLINRDFRFQTILMVILSFYLVSSIKIYILLAFIPALILWILFTYSHRIKNSFGRAMLKVVVITGALGGFLVFSQKFADTLGKYSLENVIQTSTVTSSYILSQSADGGAGYDLGPIDPSIGGMLKKFPLAVNVSLFRPYLWETRKVMQLLNALEATLFLWVTIKILIVIGPKKAWRSIVSDPTIQFCLIFAIVFAFAVGLSSGNFGALSRYRIPCLPFYAMALMLIYYNNMPLQSNILSLRLKYKLK